MSEGGSDSKTCKFTFKRSGFRGNARKRQKSGSNSGSSEEDTSVVKKSRRMKFNPMIQGTKKSKTKQKHDTESSESSEDEDDAVDRLDVGFKSNRSAKRLGPDDMGATAGIDLDTERGHDAQSVFERSQQQREGLKGKEDDKIYRGMNSYQQFIEKKDTAQGNASSGMVRKGPVRAPTNVRAITRWDYAPDICKDYKETGYCGFGDSCKFLHDRGDYKHGWQLEREWKGGQYGQVDTDADKYIIDSSDEEELPFKCLICRKSFKNPVVTKCKHYFCEACALLKYKKTQRCFVCHKQTFGVFNPAKEILDKLKNAKKEKRRLKREADGDDEEQSDEDEEEDDDEDEEEEGVAAEGEHEGGDEEEGQGGDEAGGDEGEVKAEEDERDAGADDDDDDDGDDEQ